MHEYIPLTLAAIGLAGAASQWLAWWVKLPAILFLLLTGILAGPVLGLLDPDALFGDLLLPIVSLAVAVILFEGSLTLRFEEIRGLEQVVRRLVSIGLLATWGVTTLAVHWILGFSWDMAFLFGAVTVVTGPTVIVPMLRTVRPNARLSNILRWEGIVIDPVGALLAVLVFELIVSGLGASAVGHVLSTFFTILLIGLVLGGLSGYLLGLALRHHWLPDYLQNMATLTLVFAVFAVSNLLAEESGLLTVTVMGMWLANMKRVSLEGIIDFKESLSMLLISGLFIILAARLDTKLLQMLGWGAIWVFLIMQFVARPLKVMLSTWGSELNWRERMLLSWIAPRGIVAAAVSALFALRLAEQGVEEATLLVPLTFIVIIGTVTLQSATARMLANWLGVAEPEATGFLIVGANPVARTIAEALYKQGHQVLLADANRTNIREARMLGLNTWYGDPVSGHADRNLDLVGIGHLLALSPRPEVNSLACWKYRGEFGTHRVYRLVGHEEQVDAGEEAPEVHDPGTSLFSSEAGYARLASLLRKNATIHQTGLTDDFDFERYLQQHAERAIPLFAMDTRGRIHPFSVNQDWVPGPGWTLIGLITPDKQAP